MADETLEKAFLAELEALEKFRISYSGIYPSVPLAREDPDVRRLIEAMAMFTARTRLAAERNVGESLLRMFRQHFPYLVDPVPAMAMLHARTTRRYVDVTEIPRGTAVDLVRRTSPDAPEEVFRFQTTSSLRVLPIELERVDVYRSRGRGYRMLFRFTSDFPRNDELGELHLHVNQLDDLYSSLTVFHELKRQLVGASVVWGDDVREDAPGQPCEIRFGRPLEAPFELECFEHPLQRARAFLHFPQQDLFVNVRGLKPPRNWQRFTVILDVGDAWPPELRLTAEGFDLHVVPMINVRKESADPIEHDGTKERYPVLYPDRAARMVPHSVLGVFKMTEQGLEPLEPAVIGAQRDSFEVATEGRDDKRRAWVSLDVRDAFEQPVRVVVDAFWHQPSLRGARADDLRARLADRYVDGVEWSCYGTIAGHEDSPLADDRAALLQLLSIKNQRFLGLEELRFLLRALGADRQRQFGRSVAALSAVAVQAKPFSRRSSGFKYVYQVTFESLDGSDLPALDLFCRRLLDVLTVWSVEEVVELVVRVPNLEKELQYV